MARELDLSEVDWDYALCARCLAPAAGLWDGGGEWLGARFVTHAELVCLGCADDLVERAVALQVGGAGLVSVLPAVGER